MTELDYDKIEKLVDERVAALEAELRTEKHLHRTDKQTLSEELDTTESKLSIAVAALERISTCTPHFPGDVVSVARGALAEIKGNPAKS